MRVKLEVLIVGGEDVELVVGIADTEVAGSDVALLEIKYDDSPNEDTESLSVKVEVSDPEETKV